MRLNIPKSFLVMALAGTFLAGTIFCCCIRQFVQEKAQTSCCHKTTKADPVKCGAGCSSIIKSAENTKLFDLVPSSGVMPVPPVVVSVFSFKPVHAIKSVFLNGPPGPVSVVPLYIQSRSLRI